MAFRKKYQVKPNTIGFLYKNNILNRKLEPGIYYVWDWQNRTELYTLPITSKFITVVNQEVLTKDNIAFRFSYNVIYQIIDGQKLLNSFALDKHINYVIAEAEQRIHNAVQISIRNKLSELDSESLNEKRNEFIDFKNPEIENQLSGLGIIIELVQLRDITFPKSVQDLFAKHLEAKIRAKSELENARTAVATARTLKNAAELMKDDENVKFFQLLETINKIAEKGKHTFMIGDINQLTKNSNRSKD